MPPFGSRIHVLLAPNFKARLEGGGGLMGVYEALQQQLRKAGSVATRAVAKEESDGGEQSRVWRD